MASGQESARQKMINLMYLVFLAMLAMQMDKKVLSSFGFIKEKIEDANIIATKNNTNALKSLETKASEQREKFGPIYDQAKRVNEASNEFFSYLAGLKGKMSEDIAPDDEKYYESQ